MSQRYYDGIAAEFQEMDDYWDNPYDAATWRMENALITRYLAEDDPILDLGVGFYPHVESTSGRRLVCVDISHRSLMVGRQVHGHLNEAMYFVCADALQLPFADNTLPGIVAGGELVNHVPGDVLLREVGRVLQPGGRAILSVGTKWCLDSLYSVLDAMTGHRIGYSMTREEALDFVTHAFSSTDVTWEITPSFNLVITLYSQLHLKRLLTQARLKIVAARSLNLLSALIPLPVQQNPKTNKIVQAAARFLLLLDEAVAGRIPGLRWFGGNVYIVVERR
ncbi:MAG: class I SAM-dependent methyltransferase [Chloroflexi bacterium]|nr:class I SAM-dependent methyltransferase [Chloroflexota bacterium]